MAILEVGSRFEHYQIIRQLGSGVSGESYEAEDTSLLRRVTLKLIHPWAILPESAHRQFFREMQGISKLSHPYLANVFDFGESDGRLYITRRYVGPGSLLSDEGRYYYRPPLDVIDAICYAHQLGQVLHSIHSSGYFHGSLTLANILIIRISNTDRLPGFAPFLLADVGLAHLIRRFGQPQSDILPITAAPEQFGKRVTPASDQYALAVLLYLWLAGHPPFIGTSEEVEVLKLMETIAPIAAFNSHVTPQQEKILRRALSVYPDERYPSISDFTGALMETIPLQSQLASLPQKEPDVPQPYPLPGPFPLPTSPEPAEQPQPEESYAPSGPTTETLPPPPPAPDIALPLPDPTPPLPETPEPEQRQERIEPQETAQTARLTITSPPLAVAHEALLEHEEITIGRAGSSDILLDHDTLTSRHHAMVKQRDGQYILYDRRSANGVYVNGQKIETDTGYLLRNGDQIEIGAYLLVFHQAAEIKTD